VRTPSKLTDDRLYAYAHPGNTTPHWDKIMAARPMESFEVSALVIGLASSPSCVVFRGYYVRMTAQSLEQCLPVNIS